MAVSYACFFVSDATVPTKIVNPRSGGRLDGKQTRRFYVVTMGNKMNLPCDEGTRSRVLFPPVSARLINAIDRAFRSFGQTPVHSPSSELNIIVF